MDSMERKIDKLKKENERLRLKISIMAEDIEKYLEQYAIDSMEMNEKMKKEYEEACELLSITVEV